MTEPAHTCPQIDAVKEQIRSALVEVEQARDKFNKMTIDSIQETFNEIHGHLDGVADMMEGIRDANEALRDWGSGHRERVIELEDEVYILREELEAE